MNQYQINLIFRVLYYLMFRVNGPGLRELGSDENELFANVRKEINR